MEDVKRKICPVMSKVVCAENVDYIGHDDYFLFEVECKGAKCAWYVILNNEEGEKAAGCIRITASLNSRISI